MKKERVNQILEVIKEEYVTSEYIAKRIGVSSKTIRKDLKELEPMLRNNGATLDVKQKKGYRIVVEDKDLYTNFLEMNQKGTCNNIPNTFDERVKYIINYLLQSDDWVKIDDLCDLLYISQSTLSHCLKEVRTYLEEFHIQLIQKPGHGLRIQGNEFDVRVCLRNSDDRKFIKQYSLEENEKNLKTINLILTSVFDNYSYRMSDVSYHNLVMHIQVAIMRIENGQQATISNGELNEIKGWKEFSIAKDIVERIAEEFDISIDDDEACYIAIHLAAKRIVSWEEQSDNIVINDEVYTIVSHMLDAVYNAYNVDLRDDLELRMMLSLHLVPFGVRMAYDLVLHNPLLRDIKTQYTMAYNLAVVASEELRKHYKKKIKEDEIGYFALHFNLALERKTKSNKKNILIVCGTGRGTAQLLLYQFKENFGKYLNNIQTCDALGVKSIDFTDIDYVVTTVPICDPVPVPILEIKSFMHEKDVEKIRNFLSPKLSSEMEKYIRPELFLTNVECLTKDEVIKFMVDHIQKVYPNLPDGFYDAVMHREKLAGTEFGNLVAIPHPYKAITKDTFVCICILNKPIVWGKKKVQLIYMMSLGEKADKDIMKFYKLTSKFLTNERYVNELTQKKDYSYLINVLSNIEGEVK